MITMCQGTLLLHVLKSEMDTEFQKISSTYSEIYDLNYLGNQQIFKC